MKLQLCIAATLLLCMQGRPQAQALTVGDTCPVITVKGINNAVWSTASQTNTIALICFWTTTCHGSVYTIKYLDSLQKQLHGKLTVAAVTNEPGELVATFVQNEPFLRNIDVPIVAADTVLGRMFPHILYPHVVWLDEKRIVRNITDAQALTRDNILAFWQNKEPVLPLKEDKLHYDAAMPLLVYNNGDADTAFNYRSLLTQFIPGLPMNAGINIDSGRKKIHVYCVNFSVTSLYAFALPEINAIHSSQFLTDSMTHEKYSGKTEHAFCYDLVAPIQNEALALQWMLADINRYFGLNGRIEERVLPCYAIVTTGNNTSYKGKDSAEVNALFNNGPKYMRNLSLDVLAHTLQVQENSLPVVNATKYNGPATLTLPPDLKDIAAVSSALKQYGLDIIRTSRPLPCFILTSTAPSSF